MSVVQGHFEEFMVLRCQNIDYSGTMRMIIARECVGKNLYEDCVTQCLLVTPDYLYGSSLNIVYVINCCLVC